MKFKHIRLLFMLSFLLTLTSCTGWIEFDLKRYAFGFIFTLVIGVIGLIIMGINGGNKNK